MIERVFGGIDIIFINWWYCWREERWGWVVKLEEGKKTNHKMRKRIKKNDAHVANWLMMFIDTH